MSFCQRTPEIKYTPGSTHCPTTLEPSRENGRRAYGNSRQPMLELAIPETITGSPTGAPKRNSAV